MRPVQLMAMTLLLGLASCGGAPIGQEQAAQFQQAGAPFPYNSFYCP